MRRRSAAVAGALLLLGAALAAAGCGFGAGGSVGTVELTVTRDFGAGKIAEASGEANESDTVLRFLEKEAEIQTRYGGGYVKSIDGVGESERGGHPYDWFFFVNGVLSPTGSAEVSLEDGDKVWWDIHNWTASEGTPAVVGSWPAPFTTGWEGHGPGVALECHHGKEACAVVTRGLEREGVEIKDRRTPGPRIVVEPWAELRTTPVGGTARSRAWRKRRLRGTSNASAGAGGWSASTKRARSRTPSPRRPVGGGDAAPRRAAGLARHRRDARGVRPPPPPSTSAPRPARPLRGGERRGPVTPLPLTSGSG